MLPMLHVGKMLRINVAVEINRQQTIDYDEAVSIYLWLLEVYE